jgi:uncharacterized protein (TIGR02284 family)
MQTQGSSAVISDLIIINNDRYEGYKTAAEEAKEADLKTMFSEFSLQSKRFAEELRQFVPASTSQPDRDETKNTGKLYRIWMDFKAAVTGNDRKAILGSCEFGEDVAKKHYEEAVQNPEGVPAEALTVIQRQRAEIQKGHDRVKAMRDALS